MYALNQVEEYLLTKVSKINLNNQKANTGGALIKTYSGWEELVPVMVARVLQLIQSQFTRKHPDYLPGEAALTATSMTIGKHIAPLISREPIKMKHQLALGDILIEGFLYHGFAEIITPIKRHESYVLKAAPKWAELCDLPLEVIANTIVGSYEEPLGPVTASSHKMHVDLFDPDTAYVKAIDNLQSVGWSINARILEVALHNPPQQDPITDNDAKEQKRRSKAIEHRFITGKAAVLLDYEQFYQSFEVDYRGRMYNTEPFLNFQGNDLAKGLLRFKERKELTERGEFWLAVHTAASYNESYDISDIPDWCTADYRTHLESEKLDNISVDKMTLEDRAQWTYQNADKIIRWAETSDLQENAEKPYTFLACCYEWLSIEMYGPYTSLPVPIDGSNNGWQHLGAISKDSHTGKLVGLIPMEIQSDFYVQTAKELIVLAEGNERLTEILSEMPMKHIRKGISKRGSMTRAYSAGASKIAENMFFDCKTEDFHEKYGITLSDCNKLAALLVKAINNVCPGPLQTMKYLQDLAGYQLGKHSLTGPGDTKEYKALKGRRQELLSIKEMTDEELNELNDVSNTLNEFSYELTYGLGEDLIEWDTPSGFKARYEKFTMMDFKQRATLNGKQINHVLRTPTDKPDIHGFMCGISPNYIHSMDAAHMALVIANWDGDFGAVHDSFSTHASEVDDLLEKTKSVFIEMYNKPNYFDVIRENLTNSKDDVEQPQLGDLNIGEINDSDYFFA